MNEDDAVEAFMTAIVDNKNWHVSTPQKVRVERAARLLWAQAQVEALDDVIDVVDGSSTHQNAIDAYSDARKRVQELSKGDDDE